MHLFYITKISYCNYEILWLIDRYMISGHTGIKCTKFFTALVVIGSLVNVQNMIIILKHPNRVHFLTSLIPDVSKSKLLSRLPFLLVNTWIWLQTWAYVWVFALHLYAYINCLVWTFQELKYLYKNTNNKKVHKAISFWNILLHWTFSIHSKICKTKDGIRDPKVFTRLLRSLHVLHRFWQYTHQGWFCPSHKAIAISVGTLASYGVIKLHGPRSVVMGCMAIFSLLYLWTLLRKFGKLYEVSARTLRNWKHDPKTSRWMKRYINSVPVFRIDIGSFYFVTRTTVFLALWTVLNNTITLLFL